MHPCTYCGSEYSSPLAAAECHDPMPEQSVISTLPESGKINA